MKILGLIPARGGSKGVPRKNVRLLGDIPLLNWTVKTALEVKGLDKVMVSTEDEEIAATATRAGASVPFLRPVQLATDSAKSINVVIDVLRKLEKVGEIYDAVCLLQPTTPFRSVNLIHSAIDKFITGNFSGLISVVEVPAHYHPNWTFFADSSDQLQPSQGPGSVIPRRQDLPPAYIRDGAIYLTRTEVLLGGSFFGERLGYLVNEDECKVNIDTLEDWAEAEKMVARLRKST